MDGIPLARREFSRRTMLQALGIGAAGLAATPLLSSCGVGGGERHPNGAAEVTGSFDWKKAAGQSISILQTPHPYQQSFQPLLADFTKLTGITVNVELVPEADYFTRLNTVLAGGAGNYDAFMTGAYFIWQYGPPGWMEDLKPWIDNTSATNPHYNFEDVYEGLRNATRWDFKTGSPLGTGGQWAIPWGFETNVIAYNKAEFDRRRITPPATFDELIQVAHDLTDRSAGRYGIAFRGSRSWATIHPGYMTQYSREGAKDYVLRNGVLTAAMNSPVAVEFTRKWVDLARDSGPTGWTTYEYPDVTRDLGNGTAMMAYDADSATYPLNVPGKSAQAGNIAWYPGPHGPDGSYATNLWTWSWAMSAASKKKLPAWLFIQWATGADAMSQAVRTGTFADPPRASVFDGAFKQTLGKFPGYLETFETVIPHGGIQFTPQTHFFETTEDWSVALQDIYAGENAQSRLDSLAKSNTDIVNT